MIQDLSNHFLVSALFRKSVTFARVFCFYISYPHIAVNGKLGFISKGLLHNDYTVINGLSPLMFLHLSPVTRGFILRAAAKIIASLVRYFRSSQANCRKNDIQLDDEFASLGKKNIS